MKSSLPLVALALVALLLAPLTASAQTAGPVQPAATAAPAAGQAEKVITVRVVLENGKAGATLPADLELTGATATLYAIAGQSPAYSREAKLGPDGRAEFAAVPYQDGFAFGVVARVGLTTYVSELVTPAPGASAVNVPVKVYGATTDTSRVRVSEAYLLAEAVDAGKLQISSLYILSNDGDRTIEGGLKDADGNPASLSFPLPARAQDVQFEQNDQANFGLIDGGFVARPGVPPGEGSSRVGVRYTLPYSGSLRLGNTLAYSINKLTVFVATQGITLTSPALVSLGAQQREDGVTMHVWGGEKIAANQAVQLDLSGKAEIKAPPQSAPAPLEQTATEPAKGIAGLLRDGTPTQLYGGALVAAGLLLAIAAGSWWVYRTRFAPDPLVQQERALLAALADLQEDHEAGRVEPDDYEQRHARLTEALRGLLAREAEPELEAA